MILMNCSDGKVWCHARTTRIETMGLDNNCVDTVYNIEFID